jgi:hypothetical protein
VSFLPHQHCSVFSMAQDLIATLWSSCSKYRWLGMPSARQWWLQVIFCGRLVFV